MFAKGRVRMKQALRQSLVLALNLRIPALKFLFNKVAKSRLSAYLAEDGAPDCLR